MKTPVLDYDKMKAMAGYEKHPLIPWGHPCFEILSEKENSGLFVMDMGVAPRVEVELEALEKITKGQRKAIGSTAAIHFHGLALMQSKFTDSPIFGMTGSEMAAQNSLWMMGWLNWSQSQDAYLSFLARQCLAEKK